MTNPGFKRRCVLFGITTYKQTEKLFYKNLRSNFGNAATNAVSSRTDICAYAYDA